MKPIGAYFDKAAGKALSRHGGIMAAVLRNWPALAGPAAAFARPEKLSRPRKGRGATLTLRVQPGRALELQHESDRLIARINGFFGYLAVERIAFIQAPLGGEPAPARPKPPPDEARLKALLSGIEAIGSDTLRESLARLAHDMARQKGRKSVDNP